MTNPTIKIIDGNGNEIVREMNKTELAQYQADLKNAIAVEEARKAKEATRAALLERLGITADEAALLLG